MQPSEILGSWRLVYWHAVSERHGTVTAVAHPMGEDALGLLHYGADGRMSVLIAAANRPPFATDDFLGGSDEERAAALRGFIAYAGSYELGDGFVTHRLEVSSFPNWVGTDQVRFTRLDGDRLVLSTSPILTSGRTRRSELAWSRLPAPP